MSVVESSNPTTPRSDNVVNRVDLYPGLSQVLSESDPVDANLARLLSDDGLLLMIGSVNSINEGVCRKIRPVRWNHPFGTKNQYLVQDVLTSRLILDLRLNLNLPNLLPEDTTAEWEAVEREPSDSEYQELCDIILPYQVMRTLAPHQGIFSPAMAVQLFPFFRELGNHRVRIPYGTVFPNERGFTLGDTTHYLFAISMSENPDQRRFAMCRRANNFYNNRDIVYILGMTDEVPHHLKFTVHEQDGLDRPITWDHLPLASLCDDDLKFIQNGLAGNQVLIKSY